MPVLLDIAKKTLPSHVVKKRDNLRVTLIVDDKSQIKTDSKNQAAGTQA